MNIYTIRVLIWVDRYQKRTIRIQLSASLSLLLSLQFSLIITRHLLWSTASLEFMRKSFFLCFPGPTSLSDSLNLQSNTFFTQSKKVTKEEAYVMHVNLLAGSDIKRDITENKIKSWTIACCVVVESDATFWWPVVSSGYCCMVPISLSTTASATTVTIITTRVHVHYYAALLPRRGRILRRTLSVRLSVCPSVPLSSVTWRHLANYNDTHVLFGRGPHIVRPSRPHKFLFY